MPFPASVQPAHLSPNPSWPFWVRPLPGVSQNVQITAVSAQVRFWFINPPTIQLQTFSFVPLRSRLNPNPQWPFWAGAPRGVPPNSSSTSVTVTAVSAQIRFWSPTPAILTTGTALTAASAQIRFWSIASPTISTGASVSITAASAQIRFWGLKPPTITTSSVVQASSAQIRFWPRKSPTISFSSTVQARSAQVRFWIRKPPSIATFGASSRKGDQPTSFSGATSQTGFTTQYSTGYIDVEYHRGYAEPSTHSTGEKDGVNQTGYQEVDT